MTALAHFQTSIDGADRLLAMYAELRRHRQLGARGRLDAANSDLLWLPRASVVASMSALDAYIHAVLYERIPTVLRADEVPQPLCDAMASIIPIKSGGTFREAIGILRSEDSLGELSRALAERTLSFLSYQAPEKVSAGYELIGYPNVFVRVSELWPGPRTTADDLRRNLANYAKRRNQIAHEGDREATGEPRQMRPVYAEGCREFVGNLVARLNRIVFGI
ncbi:MAG: hypothetical protein AB1832_06235 [Pseudomonadota bacterium]